MNLITREPKCKSHVTFPIPHCLVTTYFFMAFVFASIGSSVCGRSAKTPIFTTSNSIFSTALLFVFRYLIRFPPPPRSLNGVGVVPPTRLNKHVVLR